MATTRLSYPLYEMEALEAIGLSKDTSTQPVNIKDLMSCQY